MYQYANPITADKNESCNSLSSCKNTQPSQTVVHAKLEMTTPGDHDEKEADAMADAIVNGGKIRREVSNGSSGSGIAVSSAMENQLSQAQGGGRVMPDGLRNMMESGFGRDFSNVRIHTDSKAEAMNNNLSAKAFTLGNDIYFNKGQFSPNTKEGQHLVAHELTHVVQGDMFIKRKTNFRDKDSCNENRDCEAANSAWRDGLLNLNTLVQRLLTAYRETNGYKSMIAYDFVTDFLNLIPEVGGFLSSQSKRVIKYDDFSELSELYDLMVTKYVQSEDYKKMKELKDYICTLVELTDDKTKTRKIVETYLSLKSDFLLSPQCMPTTTSFNFPCVQSSVNKELVKYKGRYYIASELKVDLFFRKQTSIRLQEEILDPTLQKFYMKGKSSVRNLSEEGYKIKVTDVDFENLVVNGYSNNYILKGELTNNFDEDYTDTDLENCLDFLNTLKKVGDLKEEKHVVNDYSEFGYRPISTRCKELYRNYVILNERAKRLFEEKMVSANKKKKDHIWSILTRFINFSSFMTEVRTGDVVQCPVPTFYDGPTIGPLR